MTDPASIPAAPSGSEAKASLRPRVGLVLGSGGSKGIVHIPILEALPRLGIPVDLIAGSSIGAVVAGVYAAGALEIFRKDLRKMKREDFLRVFDPSLSRGGK
jgi:NTE family protein